MANSTSFLNQMQEWLIPPLGYYTAVDTWACRGEEKVARTITGSRRLQKAETVTDFSTSESLDVDAVDGSIPISCSFSRRRVSCLCRKAESGGRAASLWASCFRLCIQVSFARMLEPSGKV